MTALFVDTGAFYAAADRSDDHHVEAALTFKARGLDGDLVTTDHVVVETWLLLQARLGRESAMRYWDAMETGVVRVIGVTSEDFVRARRIARDWPDQSFSIIDCTSFAALERLGIEEVFAFDAHFRVYRHGAARRQAFRIVP
ncbi:MAG: PIN domain-containing protein [Planctomycetes bacterium]|nr:PIN domain-containing protein [Planctomycetota bacterium]